MRNWKWTRLETRNGAVCAYETLDFGDGVKGASRGAGTCAFEDCAISLVIETCDVDLWLAECAASVGSRACAFLYSLSELQLLVMELSLWALALTHLSEVEAQAPSRQTPCVAFPRLAFPLA